MEARFLRHTAKKVSKKNPKKGQIGQIKINKFN